MLLAQFQLTGIAIRYPDFWLMIAQHLLGDTSGPARGDPVQHRLVRDEHSLPLGDAIGPDGCLVRGDGPDRQQFVANRLGGGGHALAHAPKGIGDGVFGDDQAEQFGGDPKQPPSDYRTIPSALMGPFTSMVTASPGRDGTGASAIRPAGDTLRTTQSRSSATRATSMTNTDRA